MLATSDFRDGNAVIGKVRRCLTPETSWMVRVEAAVHCALAGRNIIATDGQYQRIAGPIILFVGNFKRRVKPNNIYNF